MEDEKKKAIDILYSTGVLNEVGREMLNNLRYEKGLSITQLAKLFGVTKATIYKWLTGPVKRLPIATRRKLALFLAKHYNLELLYSCPKSSCCVAENTVYYVSTGDDMAMDWGTFVNKMARLIYLINKKSPNHTDYFLKGISDIPMNILKTLIPELLNLQISKKDDDDNGGGNNKTS